MKNQSKNVMPLYHQRNFQVMECSSYSLTHFLLEAIATYQSFILLTRGLFRHELEFIHKICHRLSYPAVLLCKGVCTSKSKKSLNLFKFHKRRQFSSLLKQLSALEVNLTLYPPKTGLPPIFILAKRKIFMGTQ